MTMLRVILFLALLAVVGYFILKFFSKLTDVDMFSAITWAFRAKTHTRQSIRILPYAGIFCYLLSFILFYLFFKSPLQISEMKKNHAGGLLGYRDDYMQAKVYDPSVNTYINYEYYNSPFSANKFTETFMVVSFFKKPSRNYYQATKLFGLSNSLVEIIIGSLMLVILYIVLYSLVKEYILQNNLSNKFSHHFILTQFRNIVGLSLGKALIIFGFVILFIIGLNLMSVRKLKNHYRDLYSSDQERLRTELLNKVTPQDTVTGVVIGRSYQEKARASTSSRGTTIYHYFVHYTIEFKNLIRIPVYLDLKLDEKRPEVKELDKLFTDTIPDVPNYLKEYTFIVNRDYSISLKMDNIKPEE